MIAKQPNGLYCRFSSVIDTVTDWNLTEEEVIDLYVERARQEIKDILKRDVHKFEEVKDCFWPTNNTIEEFNQILAEMGDEEGLDEGRMNEIREAMELS